MANIALVNYPGRITILNGLMPNISLAYLAQGLISQGHKVRIYDYGTPSTIGRMTSPKLRENLRSVRAPMQDLFRNQSERGTPFTKTELAKVLFYSMRGLFFSRQAAKERSLEEQRIANQLITDVAREDFQAIGFQEWSGDGWEGSQHIAQLVKDRMPHLVVIGGGYQARYFGERLLKASPAFDVMAIGDGELTMPGIAEFLDGETLLPAVPNLLFRLPGGSIGRTRTEMIRADQMDHLALYNYDPEIYPAMAGNEKIMLAALEDGRGCNRMCDFCIHPYLNGKIPRRKSPERIFNEMKFLNERYGFTRFRFTGSTSDFSTILEVARLVKASGKPFKWAAFAAVSGVEVEKFGELKAGGVDALFFGLESGEQAALTNMNKRITPEQIKTVLSACHQAGIYTIASVITPPPLSLETTEGMNGNELADYLDEIDDHTLQLIIDSQADSVLVQPMGILPMTEYDRNPQKHGFEPIYPSRLNRLEQALGLIPPASLDSEAMMIYRMNYKIDLLRPPIFWGPFPWKQNGMGFRQIAMRTMNFRERVRRAGVGIGVPDDFALMAMGVGMQPKDFIAWADDALFCGDAEAISEMVARINRGFI